MKIHSLNCMSFLRFGLTEVTQVLLLETRDGLLLIDSGLGLESFSRPSWVERLAFQLDGIIATPDETAFHQVSALGFDPRDVREIIPTHLHFDHIGGACDFPWSTVHVWDVEFQAGLRPKGFKGFMGYYPARWKSHPGLKTYPLGRDRWFGLEAIPILQRSETEIWLVPLVGHSPGMCGVAIKTGNGWLWHCGDAYARQVQVDPAGTGTAFPPIARGFEEFMFPIAARQKIRNVLAEHGNKITALCSHDPEMFHRVKAS